MRTIFDIIDSLALDLFDRQVYTDDQIDDFLREEGIDPEQLAVQGEQFVARLFEAEGVITEVNA